jgi:hypothetical protein
MAAEQGCNLSFDDRRQHHVRRSARTQSADRPKVLAGDSLEKITVDHGLIVESETVGQPYLRHLTFSQCGLEKFARGSAAGNFAGIDRTMTLR